MQLFHYHLIAADVRQVEERYLGKLAFRLVARYGMLGDETVAFEAGYGWDDLDRRGFKLRLSELERGAVNIVVQPGHWTLPRVDHLGIVLDEDEFREVLERANLLGRVVQEHGGRRTFIATGVGYRLEVHPPREWIDDLLADAAELRLAELHLGCDDPHEKAQALAELVGLDAEDGAVAVGETIVRFLGGGPSGRPQLDAERFA